MNRLIAIDKLKTCATLLAALAFASFMACSPGDEPPVPTGPGSDNDPVIDYPTATLDVRVSPSTLTLSGTNAFVSAKATFRDAAGSPQEGLRVFFAAENFSITATDNNGNQVTSDAFVFVPTSVFTDSNGIASTALQVHWGVPSGSYAIRASTAIIDAPDTYAQSTLKVVNGLVPVP